MVSVALHILDTSARKSQAKQVRYAMGDGVNPFTKPPVSATYQKIIFKALAVFSGGSILLRLNPSTVPPDSPSLALFANSINGFNPAASSARHPNYSYSAEIGRYYNASVETPSYAPCSNYP